MCLIYILGPYYEIKIEICILNTDIDFFGITVGEITGN